MSHSAACTCVTCHADGRAAVLAFSQGDYDSYERHLARYRMVRGLRTAAAGSPGELRTGIHYPEDTMDDYTPPNSYQLALQRMRRAVSTPESRFAEQWKAQRMRELMNEPASVVVRGAQRSTPCSAAELAACVPPDPYAAGIAKMRSHR
jgi:hypothetical protein